MKVFAAALLLLTAACSPRILAPGPAAQPPSLEEDRFVMADGAALPLRRWRPDGKPKAVVLALHGFNDYSKAFEKPAEHWAGNGILTYAYDQRGFGDAPLPARWHGWSTLTADLAAASRLVRQRHPGLPFYLLGESMGGAVIMAASGEDALPKTDGVILVAPAVWSREIMPGWQKAALWFLAHAAPGYRASGGGFGRVPSDNIDMLRKLSRDKKVIKRTRMDAVYGLVNLMDRALAAAPKLKGPALILYGKREDIIPDKARQALSARLPKSGCDIRIVDYEAGYHMLLRDLEAELVWKDVLAWFATPDGALPSRPSAAAKKLACADALP
jgi:acylglycerol lipase